MASTRQRISRDDILSGASKLLDGGQYRDLTVDALARAMHMSKSTLYKHFISKQALIIAIVDTACQRAETSATTAAGDKLAGIGDAVALLATQLPAAIFTDSQKLPRASRRRIEQARQAIAAQVALAFAGKRADAPTAGATYIASSFAAMEQAARSGADRAEAARGAHRMVLAGLAATA